MRKGLFLLPAVILIVSLALGVFVVQSTVSYTSQAASRNSVRSPRGDGWFWWNAGITCGYYYIGAKNGTTNAVYTLYDYTDEAERIVYQRTLSISDSDNQYATYQEDWVPGTWLTGNYYAEWVMDFTPNDGSAPEHVSSYFHADCRF